MPSKAGRHPDRKLTTVGIKAISKPGRYADGNSLYLVVDRVGTKRWISRLVVQGRRRDIGLGGLRTVSLAEAREAAMEARKTARRGGDPLDQRRNEKRQIPTFSEAAERLMPELQKGWRNEKHKAQWINTLRTYAFPVIGNSRVDKIKTGDVLRALQPIWTRKPETARRVRQRMFQVFNWAKASGFCSGENPVSGVEQGLARQGKVRGNHAALPFSGMPRFREAMEQSEAGQTAKLALWFLILTAARTGEVLNAEWTEIDFDRAIWTIPKERMKAGKEHRIPLSPGALSVLKHAKLLAGESKLVFQGRKPGRPPSNMLLLMVLRRINIDVTIHGFRSTFKDWASECTPFSNEVSEMALAHSIRDRTEAAYRRGDLFEKRRELMLAWSIYLGFETDSA